jgi:hypothetical protein
MTTTQLNAHGIEVLALATLTTPRKPSDRTAPHTSRGPSRLDIIEAGAILGFTAAVTFLGLSAFGVLPYAAAYSQESTRLPVAGSRAVTVPAWPKQMDIVPVDVIDPNPVVFIGTGDGSAGSWTRP